MRVAYQPDRLLLDITNHPGAEQPGGINGKHQANGGHGIIGMRERAVIYAYESGLVRPSGQFTRRG